MIDNAEQANGTAVLMNPPGQTPNSATPRTGDPPRSPNPVLVKATAVAVIVSLLIAIAVAVGARQLPATYQASGIFRVTVPNQQGVNDSVVTAADDLATQYAQLATSPPVVNAAAAALGVPPGSLTGQISGGTISAQNLVQVNATARSPAAATDRAHAVVTAMLGYLNTINAQQGATYAGNATRYLAPIDRTVSRLTSKLKADRPAQRASDSVVLATLLGQREQVLASLATDAAAGEPTLQLISAGSEASQVRPRPTLYALIAFVVMLLISVRLALLYAARERTAPGRFVAAPPGRS